jgi:hypothetical protein
MIIDIPFRRNHLALIINIIFGPIWFSGILLPGQVSSYCVSHCHYFLLPSDNLFVWLNFQFQQFVSLWGLRSALPNSNSFRFNRFLKGPLYRMKIA